MKRSNIIILAIIAIAATSIFTACKKNKNNSTPATPKGLLYMHIHAAIDTTEIEVNDTAVDASGRRIRLSVAECYISSVTLHKADGSYITLNKAYVLKQLDGEEYFVDSVAAGNYTYVSFSIGIDATTNTNKPTSYPSTHPLAQQSPNMWFGTPEQGYIFMNIQGLVDTTATQTGLLNYPISYKTGTSSMLRNITMPAKPLTVVANQAAMIHLTADFGKALKDINFITTAEATPWLNSSIATQVANNVQNMFSYEE
jgi:hypothetical protein